MENIYLARMITALSSGAHIMDGQTEKVSYRANFQGLKMEREEICDYFAFKKHETFQK